VPTADFHRELSRPLRQVRGHRTLRPLKDKRLARQEVRLRPRPRGSFLSAGLAWCCATESSRDGT
jgi:hypothetical protein